MAHGIILDRSHQGKGPPMKRLLILTMLSLPMLAASPVAMAEEYIVLSQMQGSRAENRAFRSCMRAKYGPRYFAGVRRAHRYHMAQACGGVRSLHG
jgi:hypothetical protein